MTTIPETLTAEYIYHAEHMIDEWVVADFPQCVSASSMPGDHQVPFPFLVVRPMDGLYQGFHGMDGRSSLLIPCIQFWHRDGSLVEVRGYPTEWAPDDWEGPYDDCPLRRVEVEWAYRQLLGQWAEDNYPCCERYDVTLHSGAQVWAKVYSHDGHELPSNPPLYPQVWGSHYDRDRHKDGAKETWLGCMRFKPTNYELRVVGPWLPAKETE